MRTSILSNLGGKRDNLLGGLENRKESMKKLEEGKIISLIINATESPIRVNG